MDDSNLISIQQFCEHYRVPVTFIDALQEYELIEIIETKNENYLKITQLNEVEKMMRLHYDLEINFEGIDVIFNLLKKVESLNNDIRELYNKLERFNR